MSVSLGIFDVFASAVPGSLYVAIALYLSNRFGWFDVTRLGDVDTTILLVGFVVLSYVAGQVLGPAGRAATDRIPGWRITEEDTRASVHPPQPRAGRSALRPPWRAAWVPDL
jgi:hypothetical protein